MVDNGAFASSDQTSGSTLEWQLPPSGLRKFKPVRRLLVFNPAHRGEQRALSSREWCIMTSCHPATETVTTFLYLALCEMQPATRRRWVNKPLGEANARSQTFKIKNRVKRSLRCNWNSSSGASGPRGGSCPLPHPAVGHADLHDVSWFFIKAKSSQGSLFKQSWDVKEKQTHVKKVQLTC